MKKTIFVLVLAISMHVGDSCAGDATSDESQPLELSSAGLSPLRYRQQLEDDLVGAWSKKVQSDEECAHAIKSAKRKSCLKVCSVMTCSISFVVGLIGWGFPASFKALSDATKCH